MQNPFTELVGCAVPLQQAGMGGVTTIDLAVAVADAGGLGMLALPAVAPDAVSAAMREAAGRTSGALGINFLLPFFDPACLEAAAGLARVVEFFYATPDPALVDAAHRGGALAAWQVGSPGEARLAVDAGCDLVIAQGSEAGGHVRGTVGLLPLLAEVVDTVDVPVVAAGGIGTARSVAAAMAAGASAVRVGTRFLAAPEADVHPRYRQLLIGAQAGDTVLTDVFSVPWDAPHRVLRSAVDAVGKLDGDVAGTLALAGHTVPLPKYGVMCPTAATNGTVDAMALYAGESVGAVRGAMPAAAIVAELAAGFACV